MDIDAASAIVLEADGSDIKGIAVVHEAFGSLRPNGYWLGKGLTFFDGNFDRAIDDSRVAEWEIDVKIDMDVAWKVLQNMLKNGH